MAEQVPLEEIPQQPLVVLEFKLQYLEHLPITLAVVAVMTLQLEHLAVERQVLQMQPLILVVAVVLGMGMVLRALGVQVL